MFWNSSVSGEDAWTFQFLKKDLELISSWKKQCSGTLTFLKRFLKRLSFWKKFQNSQFLKKVPNDSKSLQVLKMFQNYLVPEKGSSQLQGGWGGSELLHSWKSSRTTWFLKNKQTDNQLRNSYIPEKGSGTLQFLKRLLGLFSSWKMFCNSYIPEKASRTLQLLGKKKKKKKSSSSIFSSEKGCETLPFSWKIFQDSVVPEKGSGSLNPGRSLPSNVYLFILIPSDTDLPL